MSLERLGEQHVQVVDKFHDLVDVDYTMNVRDYIVRASAVAAAITITLPPVAEAKGRFYSIFILAATGTFTVTLDDNNDDSERWFLTGIPFNERGQGALLYSDGRRWNISAQGIAGNQFISARTDATERIHSHISQLQMTGASAVTMTEAMRVYLSSAVQLGAWANAICGVVDLSTAGYVTGLIGVICAELDMPGGAIPGGSGTYWVFEAEVNCPTNYVGGGVPMAILGVNLWGAEIGQFDDHGVLFDLNGCTSGATHFWYDNTDGAYDEWVKVRTPSGVRYIPLMDGQAA